MFWQDWKDIDDRKAWVKKTPIEGTNRVEVTDLAGDFFASIRNVFSGEEEEAP